jgi:hypothetical protein
MNDELTPFCATGRATLEHQENQVQYKLDRLNLGTRAFTALEWLGLEDSVNPHEGRCKWLLVLAGLAKLLNLPVFYLFC